MKQDLQAKGLAPLPVPPPVIAAGLLVLATVLDRSVKTPRIVPTLLRPVGSAMIGAGVALSASAGRLFWRRGTTLHIAGEPAELVVEGPFGHTRNPMYLGLLCSMLGIGVRSGSFFTLVAPFAYWLIVNERQIPFEESVLSRMFGADFQRYRERVPRWI